MSFYLRNVPAGTDVVVTERWTQDAAGPLLGGSADGLVLNYARGYSEPDLDFLVGLPLRRLHILDRALRDVLPIYSLSQTLTGLDIEVGLGTEVDLSRLPHLERLSAYWEVVKATLSAASGLRDLSLMSYAEDDLRPLTVAPGLRRVEMKERPKVKSLDGAEFLVDLRELGIHLARNLSDLSALGRAPFEQLETLELSYCKKLNDLSIISTCTQLRHLNLAECGEFETVAQLKELRRLEYLQMYGSTNVLDGDLTPIADLPLLRELRMMSRKHYRPSVKSIQARLPEF